MAEAEQQPEVVKHLKQLENQNNKLRKLLSTALEVAEKDTASFTRLKLESQVLGEEVRDLEEEKQHLENVLAAVRLENPDDLDETVYRLEKEHVELRSKLEEVLAEIRRGNLEINELKSEDAELKLTIQRLENEKSALLEQLKGVEKKESELSQISSKIKEKVSEIEYREAFIIASNSKLTDSGLKRQPKFIKPLGRPTTLVDVIKDRLYGELQQTIARSTEEVDHIKVSLSDPEITKLIDEIEVQKTVLLNNLKLLKLNEQKELDSTDNNEIETRTIDFGASGSGSEEKESALNHEYESQPDDIPRPSTSFDQVKLDEMVSRLERERTILLKRLHSISEISALEFEERILQTQSELHSTFMREVSSEELVDGYTKKYDDATNQLYADEEARLEQRIRELEAENERIKKELEVLISQIRGDTLVSSERLISVQLKEKIAEMEKQESVCNKSSLQEH